MVRGLCGRRPPAPVAGWSQNIRTNASSRHDARRPQDRTDTHLLVRQFLRQPLGEPDKSSPKPIHLERLDLGIEFRRLFLSALATTREGDGSEPHLAASHQIMKEHQELALCPRPRQVLLPPRCQVHISHRHRAHHLAHFHILA